MRKQRNELSAERREFQTEKYAFDQEKAANAAGVAKLQEDKRLIKQVIVVLVQRLRLQLELLAIVPSEVSAKKETRGFGHRDLHGSTLNDFLHKFQNQHVEKWRGMQSKWEELQQALDDADWQLLHMKNRLEELTLEQFVAKPGNLTTTPKAHGGNVGSSVSPFSDAIAAGKETVPVAEHLKASSSSRNLAPDASDRVALASAIAKGE